MRPGAETRVRMTTLGMRRMLLVASALVFTVGIPLTLLTEQTDTYFAWTIKSFLTAAFLGGAYWASGVLELLASREHVWARGRVAVPAVLVFTTLTLVATLLHIDRFHFGSANLITVIGTWVWLAVYAVVPPLMLVLLIRQQRVPGDDPPRRFPLPGWMRALLLLDVTVMVLFGVLLFVLPTSVTPLWPWALTELTGRAVGAWLIGLGIGAGQVVWENDLERARPVLASAVVFSLLQFIALARYAVEFDATRPSAWLYLFFLLNFLVIGAYGWYAARGVTSEPTVAPAPGGAADGRT